MATSTIARRYAAAYFDLAREAGEVDARGDDLRRAVETLAHDEVVDALANPRLDVADRVRLALDLVDGLGQPARNLVRVLVERKRARILGEVLEHYRALADRAAGIVRAEVTAAVELSRAQRDTITRSLRRGFGERLEVEVRHDPAIIGGLVVRVGDRVIDTSLRTHLQQLQASLR